MPSIVISGGGDSFVGNLRDVLPFSQALAEHGLRFSHEPMRELLAYVRSVAADLVAAGVESLPGHPHAEVEGLMLAVLRGAPGPWRKAWTAAEVEAAQLELQSAGLLARGGWALEITPLGRAVLLVLEQRSSTG